MPNLKAFVILADILSDVRASEERNNGISCCRNSLRRFTQALQSDWTFFDHALDSAIDAVESLSRGLNQLVKGTQSKGSFNSVAAPL